MTFKNVHASFLDILCTSKTYIFIIL